MTYRSHAKMVNLTEVAELNPRSFTEGACDEDFVSFVPMKAVEEESGRLDAQQTKRWGAVKKGYTPFQEGDVLFAKITPCMENGKYALAYGLHGGRAAGSTEFHVFRAKPELDPKYLLFFLFSPDVRRDAKRNMRGAAGQLRVPAIFFEKLQIPIPALDEQERIVEEIEKQFSRLDAGVASLKRVRTALKRYRASVLKAACEGRLVPTETELARKENRPYETAEQLLQRILSKRPEKWNGKGKYKEPTAPDIANLPKLPEGWRWAGTEQVTAGIENAVTIGPFGSNLMVKDYRDSGVPLIFVREIRSENFRRADTRYVSPDKAAELTTHKVRGGDVVITKMGEPPGDTAIYPEDLPDAIATSDCIKLTPNLSGTTAAFLKHIIRSQPVKTQIERITRGVAQKKMSLARFKSVALPLPPVAEQTRIVAEMERRLSVAEELEAIMSANLQRANRLRQAILQRAFKGK